MVFKTALYASTQTPAAALSKQQNTSSTSLKGFEIPKTGPSIYRRKPQNNALSFINSLIFMVFLLFAGFLLAIPPIMSETIPNPLSDDKPAGYTRFLGYR